MNNFNTGSFDAVLDKGTTVVLVQVFISLSLLSNENFILWSQKLLCRADHDQVLPLSL